MDKAKIDGKVVVLFNAPLCIVGGIGNPLIYQIRSKVLRK